MMLFFFQKRKFIVNPVFRSYYKNEILNYLYKIVHFILQLFYEQIIKITNGTYYMYVYVSTSRTQFRIK